MEGAGERGFLKYSKNLKDLRQQKNAAVLSKTLRAELRERSFQRTQPILVSIMENLDLKEIDKSGERNLCKKR